jgi:hypothetical protein
LLLRGPNDGCVRANALGFLELNRGGGTRVEKTQVRQLVQHAVPVTLVVILVLQSQRLVVFGRGKKERKKKKKKET